MYPSYQHNMRDWELENLLDTINLEGNNSYSFQG